MSLAACSKPANPGVAAPCPIQAKLAQITPPATAARLQAGPPVLIDAKVMRKRPAAAARTMLNFPKLIPVDAALSASGRNAS